MPTALQYSYALSDVTVLSINIAQQRTNVTLITVSQQQKLHAWHVNELLTYGGQDYFDDD